VEAEAHRLAGLSSELLQRGRARAREGADVVKRWTDRKRAEWELRRYLKMHPSTAPDPDTKESEDEFYQQAHAAVDDFESIESAEEEAASGYTKADRRHWRGQVQRAKADAKRSLPLLIDTFERSIERRSVPEVVAAAQLLIDSLEAHLKYSVPRVVHPSDALATLHGAMLEQNMETLEDN
jgi:hypothetical protein